MWQKNKVAIILLIIGLILGYLVGTSWQKPTRSAVEQAAESAADALESANSNNAGEQLSVADQAAGSVVLVDKVINDLPVWVAVRGDRDGVATNILGAALLYDAGTHEGVMVELLAPTVAGQTYHLSLYQDNGDREFDHRSDELMSNSDGAALDVTFQAE